MESGESQEPLVHPHDRPVDDSGARREPIHLDSPEPDLTTRRRVLKWVIRVGYLAFGLAFAVPATALRSLSQREEAVAVGDQLMLAAPTGNITAGNALRPEDLAVGSAAQVFPAGKADDQTNLIEVVRISEGSGAEGLVAYSAICTHLGCAVYAELSRQGLIACPCHGSEFDPASDAAVVGGPAPRPLPSLPISVSDAGTLVVAGEFSAPVGVEA